MGFYFGDLVVDNGLLDEMKKSEDDLLALEAIITYGDNDCRVAALQKVSLDGSVWHNGEKYKPLKKIISQLQERKMIK